MIRVLFRTPSAREIAAAATGHGDIEALFVRTSCRARAAPVPQFCLRRAERHQKSCVQHVHLSMLFTTHQHAGCMLMCYHGGAGGGVHESALSLCAGLRERRRDVRHKQRRDAHASLHQLLAVRAPEPVVAAAWVRDARVSARFCWRANDARSRARTSRTA